MTKITTPALIACQCQEAYRAYFLVKGLPVPPRWNDLSPDEKGRLISAVKARLNRSETPTTIWPDGWNEFFDRVVETCRPNLDRLQRPRY